uniref:Condensin-2 complex subunit H2 n=1 Tax=Chelonoidis abingdonii TaxID=106734 RepID=A0A8C0JA21_CHEAB
MEDVESRFLHLLQPIRDLTKNWEVDVAAQLGEYLEELDQICISFDGGKTTMNFIEAALLIQGSACIYSRKVGKPRGTVVLTPCCPCKAGRRASVGFASWGLWGALLDSERVSWDHAVLSLQTVNIVPLTPMALVPPEETEKKDNPLFSRKGEILASRKDFRMNTCTPHANGAFMLELAGLSPTQYFQARCQAGDLGSATGAGLDGELPALGTGSLATELSHSPFTHVLCQEMLDPWRSLDPFDDAEDKPFKKGNGGPADEWLGLELFIANSQKYARETVLSQRIRDWEDKMEPKLQEQEERAAFDIHSYGDQLAASCGRLGEWHTFASLVAGKPAFEVCRSMLASLQLANDYTVEISQQPGLEEAVDTMRLRLLTQERAHERFRTYMAPSVSN